MQKSLSLPRVLSVVACAGIMVALALVLRCVNEPNPYEDPGKTECTFVNFPGDTVEIFHTYPFTIEVLPVAHLQSVSLHIDGNRLWGEFDKTFGPDVIAALENIPLSVSFADTGRHEVRLVATLADGAIFERLDTLYAQSPLNQENLIKSFGDSVHLQTSRVFDTDVRYVWDFKQGQPIKSSNPDTSFVINGSLAVLNAELYVESDGTRSPSQLFSITLRDNAPPSIVCTDTLMGGHHIYSGNRNFTFTARVWDGNSGVERIVVNTIAQPNSGIATDTQMIAVTFQNIDTLKSDSMHIVCEAADRQGNVQIDTFWLHFNPAIPPTDRPLITLLPPAADSATYQRNEVTVVGSMINIAQFDSLFVRVAVGDFAYPTQVMVTPKAPFWQQPIELAPGGNRVVISAFPQRGSSTDTITSLTLIMFFNPQNDITPPMIMKIGVMGAPATDTVYTERDTVAVSVVAFDNGSGVAGVTIDGRQAQLVDTLLAWVSDVPVLHDAASRRIMIGVTDKAGYRAIDSIRIIRNSLPRFEPLLDDDWVKAGMVYSRHITIVDDDNDPVRSQVRLTLNGARALDTILMIDSAGILNWKPALSDSGIATITTTLYDGFQAAGGTFSLAVVPVGQLLVDSVRFITTESDFPDSLTVGAAPLNLTLRIRAAGQYLFSARVLESNTLLLYNALDSVLTWTPLSGDTGVVTLEVVVRGGETSADTLKPQIVVLPQPPPVTVAFDTSRALGIESGAAASIGLSLSAALAETLTVAVGIDTAGSTADSNDVTIGNAGKVLFAPGSLHALLPVSIVNDSFVEGDEILALKLLSVDRGVQIRYPDRCDLTIIDNDTAKNPNAGIFVSFEHPSSGGQESDYSVSIAVRLSAPARDSISVQVTNSGSATYLADYYYAPVEVRFARDETVRSFQLTIVDDTLYEPTSETIVLTLSDPVGAMLGEQRVYTYTINPSDPDKKPLPNR
jgi:hypothetical protein